ncbi:MAG: PAS domain S-box protein, partial [Chlorobiales bacterium]|nr:PAS domain S-box protein [Chlorobiales bacterium]
MNDKQKTKAQLIQELSDARERAAELDARVQHLEKLLNEQTSRLPTPNKQIEHEITGNVYETRLQTFSNIVEQASESIVVTDLSGRITYINPATERLFGYRPEEVIGKEPIIFNAEPDPAISHRGIVETVQLGEQFTQEVLHRRKDGSVFWASINISPMRDKGGAIYGYIGLQQDITGRKYVEKLVLTERDLSMALNDVTTLAKALKICLDAAIEISEIDSGGIYLINEAGGSFDLVVHKGLSEAFVSAVLHYEKDSPGVRMVMEGTPLYFNYEKPDSPPNKHALDEGLKAMTVLPVRHKSQILGCLNIGSHSLGEIPEPSRIALETISSHIGAAIVHARQAEELRQSRQNYDMLFNTVQDFIVITNSKGDIIHANEITYKQLGYRKEDLLGQPVLMLHPKETHDAAIKRIQAMLVGEEDTCMIPLEAKDGTHIPVETKVWRGKWDGQDAVFGISRDVTARKQFEAALQESKDELASVLDNSPIPIGTFDGEKFIYISKAWHEFTGQQQTGRPGLDFFVSRLHPDDKEHVLAVWQDSWQKKVPNVAFYRLKDHSGCYRHFAGRITPIFDRSGQFKYFFGYILDVTEGKQAEEKLLESQQRLELAVNGARIGLWDWWVQTEQIIINERWAQIIGYSLSELVPVNFKKWAELCHPDDLKKSNEVLARHFAGETDYYECEVRLRHKNGEWVWILDRGKVFEWDKNGKPLRMAGTHLDITERKRAE